MNSMDYAKMMARISELEATAERLESIRVRAIEHLMTRTDARHMYFEKRMAYLLRGGE